MKIHIEIDETLQDEEVIIRCPALSARVRQLHAALSEAGSQMEKLHLCKKDTEYYIPLTDILFFETGIHGVEAHTVDDIFETRHRLYELEELLPGFFMRISKSAILNTRKVYAINRNLTAASAIEFQRTHKQVYVSRSYYKPLKRKLEEMRTGA